MPADLLRFERLSCGSPTSRSVLFITNLWPEETRPHYGSFIASQARSLCEAQMSVDVLYVRGYMGVSAYARALVELPRVARNGSYDIIHVHFGHTALASVGVRARPLVVSFCGGDLLGVPHKDRITHKSRIEVAIFRQVARTATVTITKSEEMERALPSSLRARNYVLPNGVDLDMFTPRSRDEAKAQLNWKLDEPVVLFLGNPDDPRKNVALARNAVELLRQEVPAARLHVAWGVGPDEVPSLMNAADCLIFPSRSEGSPNAVKEAMACALPVVASPVGDIPERLTGVRNCYVCEPSAPVMAGALQRALGNGRAPEARTAVENLRIGAVADQLIKIYDAAAIRHAETSSRPTGFTRAQADSAD